MAADDNDEFQVVHTRRRRRRQPERVQSHQAEPSTVQPPGVAAAGQSTPLAAHRQSDGSDPPPLADELQRLRARLAQDR